MEAFFFLIAFVIANWNYISDSLGWCAFNEPSSYRCSVLYI